jgi:hypothetical protein
MVATGELERWPVGTRRTTRTHRTRHGRRAAASACTPPRAHVGPAPREEEVVEAGGSAALLSPRGKPLACASTRSKARAGPGLHWVGGDRGSAAVAALGGAVREPRSAAAALVRQPDLYFS